MSSPTYLTSNIEPVAQNTPKAQPAMTSEAQWTFKTIRERPTAMAKAAAKAAWPEGKLGSTPMIGTNEFAGRTIMKKLFIQLTAKAVEPIDNRRIPAERHFLRRAKNTPRRTAITLKETVPPTAETAEAAAAKAGPAGAADKLADKPLTHRSKPAMNERDEKASWIILAKA